MKNSVLKFEKEELDIPIPGLKYVYDYNSAPKDLWTLMGEAEDMLMPYLMNDGDKMERISYELYGTTDYWDVLVLLNERDPLFDMAYGEGTVVSSVEEFVSFYQNVKYSNYPLVQERADALTEEFEQKELEENESHRRLHVVKRSRMSDFISLAREHGFFQN